MLREYFVMNKRSPASGSSVKEVMAMNSVLNAWFAKSNFAEGNLGDIVFGYITMLDPFMHV